MKIYAVMALVGLLIFLRPAKADYLNGFSGNVKAATTGGSGKITTNFTVLDRLEGGSVPGDAFGTGLAGFDSLYVSAGGSATFDTSARYLYLFQQVVSPTNGPTFTSFFRGGSNIAQFSSVTSYEQWSLFLTDNGGIVSTTNDFGVDGIAFAETASANLGVISASITSNSSSSSLSGVTNISFTSNSFTGSFSPGMSAGGMSRIVGYTTNLPPGFLTAASDPNFAGSAQVVPVPETGSVILALIGSGWLSLLRMRHNSKAKRPQRLYLE